MMTRFHHHHHHHWRITQSVATRVCLLLMTSVQFSTAWVRWTMMWRASENVENESHQGELASLVCSKCNTECDHCPMFVKCVINLCWKDPILLQTHGITTVWVTKWVLNPKLVSVSVPLSHVSKCNDFYQDKCWNMSDVSFRVEPPIFAQCKFRFLRTWQKWPLLLGFWSPDGRGGAPISQLLNCAKLS